MAGALSLAGLIVMMMSVRNSAREPASRSFPSTIECLLNSIIRMTSRMRWRVSTMSRLKARGLLLFAGTARAVILRTRNSDMRPAGQVLIYPGLGSRLDQGTFITHADAPMLTTKDTTFYKAVRTGGNDAFFDEPTCAPLNDKDFSALPPTVLISAECDPLSGDSGDYHRAILAAGGKSHWVDERGLVHGYLRARYMSSRARESFSRIVDAVSHLGKGEWPY